MRKPFIYAAADERYWHIYGKAFLNSAHANGHDAAVFRLPLAHTIEDKIRCATERFRLMPALVKKHGAVLALDVDAIVRKPVRVERNYDAGVFVRPDAYADYHRVIVGNLGHQENRQFIVCARVLAGIVYCAEDGLEFADALSAAMATERLQPQWGEDQAAIWKAYNTFKDKLSIKRFDKRHMNWEAGSMPLIYAAKGTSKAGREFLSAVEHWKKAC